MEPRPHVVRVMLVAALHAALGAAVVAAAPRAAHAQQAGAQQDLIARGRTLFDDQQYEESTQTLSAALLRPSNTREQKIEIYRLLALDYITLNRKDEAESAVRGLLALDPAYELPASESPRFRDFFAGARERWEKDGRPGVATPAAAAPAAVGMAHASPPESDPRKDIPLTVHLRDPEHRVRRVQLFYRSGSRGKFDATDAPLIAGEARAAIPATNVTPPLVEYYFEAYDSGGLPIASRGDEANPLRVAIRGPSKGGGGWVLPVAIGGGVLGAAAVVAGLAIAGVFKGSSSPPGTTTPAGNGNATVSVTIR